MSNASEMGALENVGTFKGPTLKARQSLDPMRQSKYILRRGTWLRLEEPEYWSSSSVGTFEIAIWTTSLYNIAAFPLSFI